ncbi:hypothetical protein J4E85_008623 [Alternaria conjuncta]|uniref:uncharacterized protein n=1 Tax=Alternaria conjuncta TaxID=181017 RepID=UPI0022206314|nr:uncharacterized protein J4E85_008623 [Alternaria conjuncta]KAI4921278.1 hypothetical protein J4E85_008623 [Alternaria conjuncta]
MKLLTNILGVVSCTAIIVTAQAPKENQASNIEAPKAQPSIDVLRERATRQWLRDLLDEDIQYPSADQNNQYRHALEDFENLSRQFTHYPTNEMGEPEREANSEEDVKRTAALRDGPFESPPANECTDAPSSGDLLDTNTDWPSVDEDADEEYADFLSSNWEYADKINALWNTDKMYVVEVPGKTGSSSEGSKRYWLHTYDGRKYGPYDNKAQVEFAL